MEGGKKPSSSPIVDELVVRKDAGAPAYSSPSSSPDSSGCAFSPASLVMGKDSSLGDLCRTFSKQRTDGQIGNAQSAAADGKSQGSPSKRQTTWCKDGKPLYSNRPEELGYFGSSVHYGGRDFYFTETPKDKKTDEGNTNVSFRGEWWQGSFYY